MVAMTITVSCPIEPITSRDPSDLTRKQPTTQAEAWAKFPRPFGPAQARPQPSPDQSVFNAEYANLVLGVLYRRTKFVEILPRWVADLFPSRLRLLPASWVTV